MRAPQNCNCFLLLSISLWPLQTSFNARRDDRKVNLDHGTGGIDLIRNAVSTALKRDSSDVMWIVKVRWEALRGSDGSDVMWIVKVRWEALRGE